MNDPFDRSVREHGASVLRVCRAVLGAGPDADDAWSETFLAALKAWPDLPDDTDVQAWLVRVAQRKAIDVIRAHGRHAISVGRPPERADPGAVHEFGQDDEDVWGAVSALPERQRLAVACHFLGGLSHAQTAEVTGSTAAAVRRACADGLANLRKTYERGSTSNGGMS